MWLSPEGAVSPLHYDNNMSILTQVHYYSCADLPPSAFICACPRQDLDSGSYLLLLSPDKFWALSDL